MKKLVLLFIIYISTVCTVVAQNNYIKYLVATGETVYQIAQKHKIEVNSIYSLNPDARNGINVGMQLILPNKNSNSTIVVNKLQHEVLQKETMYGIAKQYKLTTDELIKLNPTLETEGLKIGQIISVSNQNSNTKPIQKINTKPTEYKNYEVQSKETLYGLSKKFGMRMEDLILINPELENGVNESMIIKIPSNISVPILTTKIVPATQLKTTTEKTDDLPVEITPKLPVRKTIDIPLENSSKIVSDLSKSIRKTTAKKLYLLLPFNASRIQNDTLTSKQERLKKDSFLNMTLDFYAGALIAIDSAKTLGMRFDIKILDSQETKNSSNIDNIFSQNNLQSADAIIGPFYQSQADKLAGMLEKNGVPVISPLSKDTGKPYRNSYSTMPSNDLLKNAMFDYMKSKNGNIIAVIDAKKETIKNYITTNQPETKFAAYNDKGAISPENIKALLVKDQINFVVFASERTGTIFSVTNTLLNALSNYQIRLVILEPNPTFDFEEISLNRLTKLKLTYPSLSRDNETDSAKIFEKQFKRKNKIFPNQYATRGFDITFDTMLRLSQNKPFEQTATEYITEQVESKFDYSPKEEGGYVNKGVYILQYNNDLTITDAE